MRVLVLASLASLLTLVTGLGPASAAPTADWATVTTLSGSGPTQTDPFDIGMDQWRVTVTTTTAVPPGGGSPLILATVYQQGDDSSAVQSIQTSIPGSYGEEVSAGPGQYYIQITAPIVLWTALVEEMR